MNRRQKIIVSVTGIFIVLLALVGLTYAYFLTRIQGNTSDTSISVTTANLALVYRDGSPELITSETPIVPGKFKESKTFTVTNEGNATVDSYGVYLEDFSVTYANDGVDNNGQPVPKDQVTSFNSPTDMKMLVTCKSVNAKTGVESGTCDGVDGTLPTGNTTLLTNSIEVGIRHEYTLTLEYIDSGLDQSADMNKTINGKIQIYNEQDVVNIEGSVTGANAGDYVEIQSVPKVSQIVNGNYVLTGVEPGEHTLAVYSKDKVLRGSTILTINKGTANNVSGTTITVTDKAEIATTNITSINESNKTLTININGVKESSSNPFKEGTLAYNILNNAQSNKNGTEFSETPKTIVGQTVSAEDEKVLSVSTDDYGNTYYFRGAVEDNYVNFAGLCWRIVRIEGDGSTKLILEDNNSECNSPSFTGDWSDGNTYSYGGLNIQHFLNSTTGILSAFKTIQGSLESKISTYYSNSGISDKLKIDDWCYDDTVTQDDGSGDKYFASYTRLYTDKNPSFACTGTKLTKYADNTDMYVATLTADEVTFAGAYVTAWKKQSHYLVNDYIKENVTDGNYKYYWWLISPGGDVASEYDQFSYNVDLNGNLSYYGSINYASLGVRPAVTLKSGITISEGEGTKTQPYVIN